MPTKEGKDTPLAKEKRIIKSLDVFVMFRSDNEFDVLEFDPAITPPEQNKIKYIGKVTPDKTGDECSCDSHWYGMKFEPLNPGVVETKDAMKKRFEETGKKGESRYVAENGFPYQCKHLIRARFVRYGEKME